MIFVVFGGFVGKSLLDGLFFLLEGVEGVRVSLDVGHIHLLRIFLVNEDLCFKKL